MWVGSPSTRGARGTEPVASPRAPRPGPPRTLTQAKAEEILRRTTHEIPHESTHWSLRLMARYAAVSIHQVQQVWAAADLRPHRLKTFKISNDPKFPEKVPTSVALYRSPPTKPALL